MATNKKYKLTDGNMWATDGIYDFDQGKTQREVNSDLNGAITSKIFTKTVTFSTSAITSTNPISDSKFTANTRLVSYQFINSSSQETGNILADLTTNTAAGSCTVTLNKGYAAGSVILTFGNPT